MMDLKRGFKGVCLVMVFIVTIFNIYQVEAIWLVERVDAPHMFSYMTDRSLAVTDDGVVHIAYGGDNLYYAYHDGSAWQYETVDTSSGVGQYASLALDASGKAHISYYDAYNRDLKYATNVSGSWITEVVDSEGDVGWFTSLALDASGKAHISYYDGTNYDLKYATNARES